MHALFEIHTQISEAIRSSNLRNQYPFLNIPQPGKIPQQTGLVNFKIVWPCIVTDTLWIKPIDALNSSFIGITTLHVSGSLSAHHQEFLAVHQHWYILCSLMTVCCQEQDGTDNNKIWIQCVCWFYSPGKRQVYVTVQVVRCIATTCWNPHFCLIEVLLMFKATQL
jgi:hypothetical protein